MFLALSGKNKNTGKKMNYYELHEYWPVTASDRPAYPPVSSAESMCVKFEKDHFDLLLPKKRQRSTPSDSFVTPKKYGRPLNLMPSCKCKGQCGTRGCICFRDGRECSVNCHPLNVGNCENRLY